ncbi:MAG TPA: extracellular solute-binding protein [Candidatus Limiplasma sp.]|nr:extracellular solute-binding protein [Candidatus Limiplasma sp.]
MIRRFRIIVLVCIILFSQNTACAVSQTLMFGGGQNDKWADLYSRFEQEHPGYTVKMDVQPEDEVWLVEQMLSQSADFDLYRVSTENRALQTLAAKKYLLALPDNVDIKAIYNNMLPVMKKTLLNTDGQPAGVPISVYFPYVFKENPELMAEIGLSEDDVPKTLLAMFEFVDQWQDNYEEQYPNIVPFYIANGDYTGINSYISIVMEMYRNASIAVTGELNYDTPIFRELLSRVDTYTVPVTKRAAGNQIFDTPDMQNCLFYCSEDNLSTFFTLGTSTWMEPLAIADGYPQLQPFALTCVIVNPFSKHIEAATDLLCDFAQYPLPVLQCVLSPDLAQPIERTSFKDKFEYWTQTQAAAQEALKTAQGDAYTEASQQLADAQAFFDHLDIEKYKVSPDMLQRYQNKLTPYLFACGQAKYDTTLLADNIKTLVSQYLDGALTTDELIVKLNRTVTLSVREDAQ